MKNKVILPSRGNLRPCAMIGEKIWGQKIFKKNLKSFPAQKESKNNAREISELKRNLRISELEKF